jgi:hypothetical protein
MKTRVTLLASLAVASLALAQADADLALLKGRGIATTGPALLELVKKRTPTPDVARKLDALIKQLDDDEQDVREKAMQALSEMGPLARGKLAEAIKSGDAEVKRRARWALEKIGTAADDAVLLPAVARVLAARKPEGALEALLAFLPHVDNVEAAEEVAGALSGLAKDKDGKPAAPLLKALSSPSWSLRAAAGRALAPVAAARDEVLKLLKDESPAVRRRVALALLDLRDRASLATLVALTGSDSEEDAAAAEDALLGLAGEKAPDPAPSGDPKAREKARAAWEGWLKGDGAKLDLAKADLHSTGRGMTLMGVLPVGKAVAQIIGYDAAGNKKFSFETVRNPSHASMSRRDRVIVSEWNTNRVMEVDLKGKIHATINVGQPLCAYRLRNGNLFVAGRSGLFVYGRDNKQVQAIPRPTQVATAYMFDDGTISLITTNGVFVRLDKDGKEKSSTNIGGFFSLFGLKAHFNADGSFVVPDYQRSTVKAYDATGKLKWEASVVRPSSVTQLPGGGYLVTQRLGNQVVELDKDGKLVKTKNVTEGRPLFYDRR